MTRSDNYETHPQPLAAWHHAGLRAFPAGIATLIAVAASQNSDLVSANYYEQEIKYQTRLDQLNRTAWFNDQVKVAFDNVPERFASRCRRAMPIRRRRAACNSTVRPPPGWIAS